jgi:uncharacterized protein
MGDEHPPRRVIAAAVARRGSGKSPRRLRRGDLPYIRDLLPCALLALPAVAHAQHPPVGAAPDALTYANVVVEDVRIPMRDGVTLGATLVRPQTEERLPALVFRTPYGKDRAFESAQFPLKAARHGYLVFLVDVRGRYTSEGEFRAYHQERDDGFDTIEWVAGHERSDGSVGTYGGSYPGYVQWLALAEAPRGLRAVAPAMTPVSSHHFFYMGGAFNLTWYDWFIGAILPDMRARRGDDGGPTPQEWAGMSREWYARRPLADFPFLKEHAPYYYDWLRNPDQTAWWEFADVEKDFGRMTAPVLLLTGWYDNTYGPIGAVRGFNGMRERAGSADARAGTRLVIGPWNHTSVTVQRTRTGELDFGASAGLDYDDLLLRFFDRHLRGRDRGVDALAPVQIFVMGENRWRAEQEWPLARAQQTSLYLDGGAAPGRDGTLSFTAAVRSVALDRFTFDPRKPVWDERYETSGPFDQAAIEQRSDVLIYTSAPLEQEIEITGEVLVELYVSSSARDTDFAVMLTDVHPDGRSFNLMGPEAGYLRMRYRDGYERQVLMEPDSVYRITIGNMPTSNLFRVGHRIRLQVTSSRAPHLDPNPNTGEEIATETQLRPATQTIHRSATRPSRLILPVIPR